MKLNNAINTAVLNLVISGIPSIHKMRILLSIRGKRFKPCYKWNTFNTIVITIDKDLDGSFKPCYKWNTFNTFGMSEQRLADDARVLNLVISGIPSILEKFLGKDSESKVLNLVISGIPSIPLILIRILILWLVNSLFRG